MIKALKCKVFIMIKSPINKMIWVIYIEKLKIKKLYELILHITNKISINKMVKFNSQSIVKSGMHQKNYSKVLKKIKFLNKILN